MNTLLVSSVSALIAFMLGGYAGRRTKNIPLVRRKSMWAIGIYTGNSPFTLSEPEKRRNPVLTASDVKDASADFIADPFMVFEQNVWYMFFEVMNRDSKKGEI